MTIVDTSAWIEYFAQGQPQTVGKVRGALLDRSAAIGDLVYCEIMMGMYREKDRHAASSVLLGLPRFELTGFEIAAKAAENYRKMRTKGITIRATIDVLIGTFCAEQGHKIIHHDRDFDLMAPHIGLKVI